MPNAAHPPKLSTRLALLALVALAALLIGAGVFWLFSRMRMSS